MRKMSPAGRLWLTGLESKRLAAYQDGAGIWTIGVGHTGPEVHPGMCITTEECDQLFERDLLRFEKAVSELILVPLTQWQFDALVSFTFNVGITALASSTLLKKLNDSMYSDVPAQLARWNKIKDAHTGQMVVSQGLMNRRNAEITMWNAHG
jgi:lysozyme